MKDRIEEDNKHYYTGNHLRSTQLVTDVSGVAVQQVEYAPFGEVVNEYNIDWSSGQVPDFKFNAKELDEESGMYYFEARYQSPPVFISRDPLFEKYPMFSPYSYCANNPLRYIDPTGETIVITGEDGTTTTYKAGMEYNGSDKFTAGIVSSLNKMNSVKNGATVLGELIGSNNVFDITNNASANKETASFKENNAGGGTLNMSGVTDLKSLSHELFHGYQHEKGQGGASIFNEIEAYLYSEGVNMSYKKGLITFASQFFNAETTSAAGKLYESSVRDLLDEYDAKKFNNAVNLFQSQSQVNYKGDYTNYPKGNEQKSLLKSFYPLYIEETIKITP
jgi:RHS repeat-associated protein